ncbi:MAG: hypothetical protein RR416_05335 [Clostridia bacterium]
MNDKNVNKVASGYTKVNSDTKNDINNCVRNSVGNDDIQSNVNCDVKNDMNDNKNNKVGNKDNADNKKIEKLPTKGSIYCTDIFFIAPFLLIAIAGFVCITFVGACVAISACIWLFKSFSLATSAQQWGGFALSILMLATAAIMFWSDYFIVKSTTKGVKRHIKERKEILCKIERTQDNA